MQCDRQSRKPRPTSDSLPLLTRRVETPVLLSSDAYGTSIYTEHDLAIGTRVVCCPFSLAITPTQVRRALPLDFFPRPDDPSDDDDDRRLMVLYLVLHLFPAALLAQISSELALTHEPYISALPSPSSIRTPLYFSPAERALLRGTNLDGATRDREQLWQTERAQALARLRAPEEVKNAITWDRWLWACTMLSYVPHFLWSFSRARTGP